MDYSKLTPPLPPGMPAPVIKPPELDTTMYNMYMDWISPARENREPRDNDGDRIESYDDYMILAQQERLEMHVSGLLGLRFTSGANLLIVPTLTIVSPISKKKITVNAVSLSGVTDGKAVGIADFPSPIRANATKELVVVDASKPPRSDVFFLGVRIGNDFYVRGGGIANNTYRDAQAFHARDPIVVSLVQSTPRVLTWESIVPTDSITLDTDSTEIVFRDAGTYAVQASVTYLPSVIASFMELVLRATKYSHSGWNEMPGSKAWCTAAHLSQHSINTHFLVQSSAGTRIRFETWFVSAGGVDACTTSDYNGSLVITRPPQW